MDKTKKIYFLFSFVMIIACYALNKSYSMFVASEEKNVVDSVVPNLVSELSVSSITLSGNEEYLIKQTITNTSSVSINYALNANGSNYTIKMTSDDGNKVLGSLETNQSDIVYLYVKNDSTESNTITFELNKNYTTLNNDLTSNIDSTNLYTPVTGTTIPYQNEPNTLKYHILNNYINSNLYTATAPSQTNTTAVEAFNGKTENTIKLPLSTGTVEIPELTTINSVETEEKGLYKAPDDYGDSYYFRGASTKNYVSFAGFTWRIVRINGDGSVRLVFSSVINGTTSYYASDGRNNGAVGYMRGSTGTASSLTYDLIHMNSSSSYIKTKIDTWYTKNLTDYSDYLADVIFCSDKSLTSGTGNKTDNSYYSAYGRLISQSTSTPSFECAKGATNTYSRYTTKDNLNTTTSKGVEVNKDLTYPIALLTADEIVFAGAYGTTQNTSFYLNNGYYYFTMTPKKFYNDLAYVFVLDSSGAIKQGGDDVLYATTDNAYVRPVINLRADIEVESGNGTNDDNIYKVKLPTE